MGKERYTTVELKRLEGELLTARLECTVLEKEIFERIKREVVSYHALLRRMAHALAHVDALLVLARLAYALRLHAAGL